MIKNCYSNTIPVLQVVQYRKVDCLVLDILAIVAGGVISEEIFNGYKKI